MYSTLITNPPPATQPDNPATPPSPVQDNGKAASPVMTHKHHFLPMIPQKKSLGVLPDTSTSDSTELQTSHIAQVDEKELCEAVPGNNGHKSQVKFMEQVLAWVKQERQHQRYRKVRKATKQGRRVSQHLPDLQGQTERPAGMGGISVPGQVATNHGHQNLADSVIAGSPETTIFKVGARTESINRLEMNARAVLTASTPPREVDVPTATPSKGTLSRRSSRKSLHSYCRSGSYGSDTDYTAEGDFLVPECEVTLETPEKISWGNFKKEVLKLTHTLGCKGWRKVALERYKELEVQRISGALTNVVYMVSPPQVEEANKESSIANPTSRRRPV